MLGAQRFPTGATDERPGGDQLTGEREAISEERSDRHQPD